MIPKHPKKFIFHTLVISLTTVFLSAYIGFFLPDQYPKLNQTLHQTLCNQNEKAQVNRSVFNLPGEVRISNQVMCKDENGVSHQVNEVKAFVIVGMLYPLITAIVFSILLGLLFRNRLNEKNPILEQYYVLKRR